MKLQLEGGDRAGRAGAAHLEIEVGGPGGVFVAEGADVHGHERAHQVAASGGEVRAYLVLGGGAASDPHLQGRLDGGRGGEGPCGQHGGPVVGKIGQVDQWVPEHLLDGPVGDVVVTALTPGLAPGVDHLERPDVPVVRDGIVVTHDGLTVVVGGVDVLLRGHDLVAVGEGAGVLIGVHGEADGAAQAQLFLDQGDDGAWRWVEHGGVGGDAMQGGGSPGGLRTQPLVVRCQVGIGGPGGRPQLLYDPGVLLEVGPLMPGPVDLVVGPGGGEQLGVVPCIGRGPALVLGLDVAVVVVGEREGRAGALRTLAPDLREVRFHGKVQRGGGGHLVPVRPQVQVHVAYGPLPLLLGGRSQAGAQAPNDDVVVHPRIADPRGGHQRREVLRGDQAIARFGVQGCGSFGSGGPQARKRAQKEQENDQCDNRPRKEGADHLRSFRFRRLYNRAVVGIRLDTQFLSSVPIPPSVRQRDVTLADVGPRHPQMPK
ncbi:MAG: hypothetical protein A4E29_00930 [Methanomassiliicoccales archaeon PtaB.Bin134]|nr:MAG: hypothetical protein A4E29_00930 [Methanomassiliicoccales archaeon PtaB.Bin134]